MLQPPVPDYRVHPGGSCASCASNVLFIVLLDVMLHQSWWAGARLAGKRELSERGQACFQRSRLPDTPISPSGRHHPAARASRPHALPSVETQFPCDVAADRPAGWIRMGPAEAEAGRRCTVDCGGGDGRTCWRICAGGTPALPDDLPRQGRGTPTCLKVQTHVSRQLSLMEVHQSSCLFVFIGGPTSSETNGCFPSE